MDFSESSSVDRAKKVEEAGHLLEEGWFFGNFLDTKSKTMSRCYSDLCPSSVSNQELLVKKSKKKTPKISCLVESSVPPSLIKAPSLPASMARGEFSRDKERIPAVNKSSSRQKLARAPSLPPCIIMEREEDEDHESEFTMGRLIRQASLNSSDMLRPRPSIKGTTQSISMPRQPRKQSTNMEGWCYYDQRSNNPMSQEKTKGKSPSTNNHDLDEELQGFKKLGLTHGKEDLNPGMVNVHPGLQQEKSRRVDQLGTEEGKIRRKQQQHLHQQQPYPSQSWLAKSSSPAAPRIPGDWVDKSSTEDMKAQIKFWARAVASNVRQEC